MRCRFWNAKFFLSLFAIAIFASAASAQDFRDRSDAEFALLGLRIESGLRWDIERRHDETICKLLKSEVQQRTRKKSPAVQQAALDLWNEAKQRCEARKLGIEPNPGFQGLYASAGVGGQFDLNASTDTNSIGSAGVYDPNNKALSKVGLSSSGVVGQIGIGYDWNIKNLLNPARTPGVRYDGFVGIKLDVTFGGGSATVQGIPGIVPFIPAGVATMDRLTFRKDVSVDFTGRIGTYLTPMTGVYVLGGVTAASVKFKYECTDAGFCGGIGPVTPAYVSEQSKWTYGGVIGVGAETKVGDWLRARGTVQTIDAAALSLYVEYRAHIMQPVDIDAGTLPTRYTSQRIDPSFQDVIVGARIRF